jgi:hypothetical protein
MDFSNRLSRRAWAPIVVALIVGCGSEGDGSSSGSSGTSASSWGLSDAVGLFGAYPAGDVHLCALRRTGRLACGGQNTYGELGDCTTTNASGSFALVADP